MVHIMLFLFSRTMYIMNEPNKLQVFSLKSFVFIVDCEIKPDRFYNIYIIVSLVFNYYSVNG